MEEDTMAAIKWEPRDGGMDKDTDVTLIKDGNYIDAKNIRPLTEAGQQSYTRFNVKGNKFSYREANVIRQNKRVVIAFNVSPTAPATVDVTFKASVNGLPITATVTIVESDVSTTMTNAEAAFQTAMQAAGYDAYDFVQVVDNVDFGNLTFTLGGGTTVTEGIDWVIDAPAPLTYLGIVEEAIPQGLAGQLHPIESFDLLGDLFVWWTTNTELPSTIGVLSSTNATPIVITSDVPHGLTQGEPVVISGHETNTNANGKWIVSVLTATTFELIGSTGNGVGGNTGIIALNAFGLGEISVAQKDLNTNVWTAIRLIRSVQFNFSTKHQPIARANKNSLRIELYWVDAFNVDRVLYYKGPYVTDGALFSVDSLNEYTYNTLDEATSLIRREPDVSFSYISQAQSGGSLASGNWRYAVAFGTGEGFTPYSRLSSPVPVYTADYNDPINVVGDQAGTITGKINYLSVSGIPTLYTTMRIVGVNYVNGAVIGYIVKDQDITGDTIDGLVFFNHSGDEPTIADFDLQTLFIQLPEIENSALIEIIDNRMLLGNITLQTQQDLSAFALTIEHSLLRGTIDSVGSGLDFTQGEYFMPENVFRFTSYMLNETYRFGVRLRNKKTKIWTPVYFVDDITFDRNPAPRRITSLSDFALTTTPGSPGDRVDVYYYYVQFTNVNFDFILSSGQTIRDVYDKVEFLRSDVTIPTILNNGLIVLKNEGNDNLTQRFFYKDGGGTANDPDGTYAVGATDDRRRIGIFYTPDVTITGGQITFQPGDQIINFGNPQYDIVRNTGIMAPGNLDQSILAETIGNNLVYDTHNIEAISPIVNRQSIVIAGNNLTGAMGSTVLGIANTFAFVIDGTYLTNVNTSTTDHGGYFYQYYRPNRDQYGSPEGTTYITISSSFEIGTKDISYLFNVYGGDVFTQKTYLKLGYSTPSGYGFTFGFYSQNRINSQLRSVPGIPDRYVFPRGNTSGTTPDQRIDQVNMSTNIEPMLYNRGYNYPELLETYVAYNAASQFISTLNRRIYYSEIKPDDNVSDQWREYRPLNFYDVDAAYGPLTGMWSLGGELYTLQWAAFTRQYFNARGQMNAGAAGEVVIGDGTVFSRRGMVLSTVGCKQRFAQVKGRTESGNDTLYWISTPLSKMCRFGVDGNINLSDVRGLRSWLPKALVYVNSLDMPAAGAGIHGFWWERFAEVGFTVMGYNTSILPYDAGTVYMPTSAVSYVNASKRNQQFEETIEFYKRIGTGNTIGVLPTDQTKWELVSHDNLDYYNQYTLIFNEVTNKFQCFYSHKPPIYFEWQSGILSPRPVSFFGSVYEHGLGDYNDWYEQSQEPFGGSVTKQGGSLSIIGVGTSFLLEFIDGFGIVIGGLTFTINQVISNGGIIVDKRYRLSDGTYRNDGDLISFPTATGYGIISRQCEHGYLTSVVNIEPNISKTYLAQQYNTEIIPKRVDYSTMDHISYNEEEQYTQRLNMFPAPIRNNIDAVGSVIGDTSKLWGNYLISKLRFKRTEFQKLTDYVTKIFANARINQK